jgi:hypothetical protein
MSELAEIMQRLSAEQTKYSTKKTKVQATRVRASLLELKKACDCARRATLEEAKAIPAKPRSKKLVSIDADDEEMPGAPLGLEREITQVVKPKRVRKPSTKKMEELSTA